ncbi:helix-turn-helix domain-containing protein [Gimesia sp.]|uniref:helix-turn-helix domain-containing protein n=1 Tax=Gimesia sp. TaxID=2024833 RepID=UPI003A8E93C3
MNNIIDQDRFSLNEVAEKLDVHIATVWRWTLSGVKGRRLKTVQIGGRRYALLSDLEAFLQQRDTSLGNPKLFDVQHQQRQAKAKARLDAEL